jgi:hypothetical protein
VRSRPCVGARPAGAGKAGRRAGPLGQRDADPSGRARRVPLGSTLPPGNGHLRSSGDVLPVLRDIYPSRMSHLTDVPWPRDPIPTDRLVLRPKETDRCGYIELFCTEEARRYPGGPLDSDGVEAAMPATPGNRPGLFAVESGGEFIGVVTLDRRDPESPGHVRESANEVEIGYMSFLLLGAMAKRRKPSPQFLSGPRRTSRRGQSSCALRPLTRNRCGLRPGSAYGRWRDSFSTTPSSGSGCATEHRLPSTTSSPPSAPQHACRSADSRCRIGHPVRMGSVFEIRRVLLRRWLFNR